MQTNAQVAEIWKNGKLSKSYQTIQNAFDDIQAGDLVKIKNGIYHETLRISNAHGTAKNPIIIEAEHPGKVTLDGAVPELQKPNNLWTQVEKGIYRAIIPWKGESGKSICTWVSKTSDDMLLAGYGKYSELERGIRHAGSYCSGDTIFVKLHKSANPNQRGLNLGRTMAVLEVENCSNLIIHDLSITHGGYYGLYLKGNQFRDIEINNCRFRNSFRAIATDEDAGKKLKVKNNTVENGWPITWTHYSGYFDGGGPCKTDECSPGRPHAFYLKADSSEIANNHISGCYDGMMVQGYYIKIHHNTIHNIADDGIELESTNSGEIEFFNNLIYDAFTGISINSQSPGNIYIYRNCFETTRYDDFGGFYGNTIKSGTNWAGKAENVKIYQNSLYSVQRNLWEKIEGGDKDNWDNWDIVNNIFYSLGDNVTFWGDEDCHWESNLYFGDDCPENEPGHKCGNPKFMDLNVTPKNMKVSTQSIAIDNGSAYITLKGYPDSVSKFSGKGWDIGAWELGIKMKIGADPEK